MKNFNKIQEDFVDLEDIFREFFLGKKISKDAKVTCNITKYEAKEGAKKKVTVPIADICDKCCGDKNDNGKCIKCNDRGYNFIQKEIEVDIPKNVKNNECLVYKGMGHKLSSKEECGNIYVKIHIYGKK